MPGLELDQHVDVARGSEIVAQDGAEERQPPHVMALAELGNPTSIYCDPGRHTNRWYARSGRYANCWGRLDVTGRPEPRRHATAASGARAVTSGKTTIE
jgi:hypothetical protein